MDRPLLGAVAPRNSLDARKLRKTLLGPIEYLVSAVARYEEITRSDAYLSSRVSRRFLWKVFIPLTMFANLSDDSTNGKLKLPWAQDANVLCWWEWTLASALLLRSATFWKYDITTWDEIAWVATMTSNCTVTRPLWQYPMVPNAITSVMPFMVAFGVHMPFVLLFGFVIVATGEPKWFELEITMVPIWTILAGIIEFSLASLVTELDMHRTATEKLLDSTSDGFCIVSRDLGHMKNCSPQLSVTLDCEGLEGKSLTDFMKDQSSWSDLARELEGSKWLLVSFSTGSFGKAQTNGGFEFDAKLIPFAVSGDLMSICVQVMGERRPIGNSDMDGSPEEVEIGPAVDEIGENCEDGADSDDEDAEGDQLEEAFEALDSVSALGLRMQQGVKAQRAADTGRMLEERAPAWQDPLEHATTTLAIEVDLPSTESHRLPDVLDGSSLFSKAPSFQMARTAGRAGSMVGSQVSQLSRKSFLSAHSRRSGGASEASFGSGLSYHSICKVGAADAEEHQMETVTAEVVSVGCGVQGERMRIEFKSKCIKTQLEWQKKLIQQQNLLLSAANTELEAATTRLTTLQRTRLEQNDLLRGFRKIVTREADESAPSNTVIFIIEEEKNARDELDQICGYMEYSVTSYGSLAEGVNAIQEASLPAASLSKDALKVWDQASQTFIERASEVGSSIEGASQLLDAEIGLLIKNNSLRDQKMTRIVLLGCSMLAEWVRQPVGFDDSVFIVLVSRNEEFEDVGRCLLASKESEVRERLRRIGIEEYLMFPLSLDCLQNTVQQAIRKHCSDEFLVLDQLGIGGSGIVNKTKRLSDGQVFALKQVNLRRPGPARKKVGSKVPSRLHEQEIMQSMKEWPTLLKLIDAWEQDRVAFLLTPVMEGGNLRMQMQQTGQTSPSTANVACWYAQTLHGVCYLHHSGVIHRDLKPENLILATDRTSLCICDFGSAVRLSGPGPHPKMHEYVVGGETTAGCNAPEVLQEQKHYAASDVWSTGFLFYQCLLPGAVPDDDMLGSFDQLNTGLRSAAVNGIIAGSHGHQLLMNQGLDSVAMLPGFVAELLETLHPSMSRRPTAAALAGRSRSLQLLEDCLRRRMEPGLLDLHLEHFAEIRQESEAASQECLVQECLPEQPMHSRSFNQTPDSTGSTQCRS